MSHDRSIAILLLAAGVLLLPATARSQDRPNDPAKSLEPDLILLAVRIEGRHERVLLDDIVSVYEVGDQVFVPLGELSRVLELAIGVDPSRKRAEGFILSEDRVFRLDVDEGTLVLDGNSVHLGKGGILVFADDLYVDARLLSRWLPLDLAVERRDMVLAVRPKEPLPRELRRLREHQSRRALAGAGRPDYPALRIPYAFLDGPFADLHVFVMSSRDGESGRRTNQTFYTADVSAELFYLESRLFATGDESGVSEARFGIGRTDPEGGLLGDLGAREVLLGEGLSPGLDLVVLPRSGPGLLVSSFPLQQPDRFDAHTFVGDVPAGWDVELYRNDALIAYQRARPDGRYHFEDVPLLFGLNVFRLVFYGPHGERREEQRTFNVGRSLTPPGHLYYRAAFHDPPKADHRSVFELDFGVHRQLSVNVGASVVERSGATEQYARTGLRGFGGRAFFTADLAVDRRGGRALKAAMQSALGPLALSFQHTRLVRFQSEVFEPVFGPISSRSVARVDGAIRLGRALAIPTMIQWRRDALESGQNVDILANRISAHHRGFSITNELDRILGAGEGPLTVEPSTRGLMLLSTYRPRFALRGEVAYDLEPAKEMTGLSLVFEPRFGGEYRGSVGVLRRFREDATHLIVGANKLEGSYGFGLSADYSEVTGLSGSLSLSIGLSRDSRTGRWSSRAKSMTRSGGVSARVFLDADADGVMDAEERPLERIGLSVDGVNRPVRTDRDGAAFVDDLVVHRGVDIAVSMDTIEDPLWMPGMQGVRLFPRPGKVARIDFPIVVGSEITGTVYVEGDGGAREAGGIRLELVDEGGTVVRESRSAMDGFYDIAGIPPGRYWLRVDPDQLSGLRLSPPPPIGLRIIGERGTVFDGFDFHLYPVRPEGREPTAID